MPCAKGGETCAPPAQIVPDGAGRHGEVVHSISFVRRDDSGPSVIRLILSPYVLVNEIAIVDHSLLFEGVVVGHGVRLQNCIVDNHMTIPSGEQIGNDLKNDRHRFSVSPQGVVVVPRKYQFQHSSAKGSATLTQAAHSQP